GGRFVGSPRSAPIRHKISLSQAESVAHSRALGASGSGAPFAPGAPCCKQTAPSGILQSAGIGRIPPRAVRRRLGGSCKMNLLRSLAAGAAVWAAEMAGGFVALGGKLDDYSDTLGPFLVGLCCGAVIAVALHLFWVRPVARTILQRAHRFVRTTELGSYGDIQG